MPRLSLVFLLLVVAGCAFHPTDGPPPPPPLPVNDTPQNLMLRFEGVYELQSLQQYEPLLTSDFRYTFSAASDPNLVTQYGDNWGKDDETEATKHLFEGFTNTSGQAIPAASRIDMTLSGVQYGPDYQHADSTDCYQRVVVTTVEMTIEIPGTPDPTLYQIAARHEFYVVRGDVAVLDAGQEPRADRWYIRRWDDLSTGTTVRKETRTQASFVLPLSWGAVRAALS